MKKCKNAKRNLPLGGREFLAELSEEELINDRGYWCGR